MILNLITIAFTAMLAENFVLVKFMGICPFLGVSKKITTAFGMGMAVLFVMLLSSVFTWFVQLALNALGLEYLQTIAFILVIASLVQFVETVMKKYLPALYKSLGIYLPLITTNCAVLGSAILIQTNGYNLLEAIVFGIFAALGFTLAIVIFAGIRERLEESDIPEFMKGLPISLVSASLLSLAFLGFQGFNF
ncbi:MAG: RnfABCDGE type electron transport complex subunit A [Clostridia bacterium]|nr:RnfABCDGE type electron transport complex subunit A [Clostridia bacterium]